MATFAFIGPGEEKTAPGLRVRVTDDGESVWMQGKWLELADHHCVAWIDGKAVFVRRDGRQLMPGQFPAWSVRSPARGGSAALMFDATQFRGGYLTVTKGRRKAVFTFSEEAVQEAA